MYCVDNLSSPETRPGPVRMAPPKYWERGERGRGKDTPNRSEIGNSPMRARARNYVFALSEKRSPRRGLRTTLSTFQFYKDNFNKCAVIKRNKEEYIANS